MSIYIYKNRQFDVRVHQVFVNTDALVTIVLSVEHAGEMRLTVVKNLMGSDLTKILRACNEIYLPDAMISYSRPQISRRCQQIINKIEKPYN